MATQIATDPDPTIPSPQQFTIGLAIRPKNKEMGVVIAVEESGGLRPYVPELLPNLNKAPFKVTV